MKLHAVAILLTLILSGCASIDKTSSVEQPLNRQMIAGVGDVILHVNKQRNLENAFGKADIFGRKTNEGFTEIKFAGVERTGDVVLYRKDVHIITNETTMSRTPISTSTTNAHTSTSGTYNGNAYNGTVNGTGQTIATTSSLTPVSDFHIVVPADTIAIRLAPSERKVPIEGYVLEVLSATPNSIEYTLSKLNQP